MPRRRRVAEGAGAAPSLAEAAAFWVARYAGSDRVWSGRVNTVLATEATTLKPGTALDLVISGAHGLGLTDLDHQQLQPEGDDLTVEKIAWDALAREMSPAFTALQGRHRYRHSPVRAAPVTTVAVRKESLPAVVEAPPRRLSKVNAQERRQREGLTE